MHYHDLCDLANCTTQMERSWDLLMGKYGDSLTHFSISKDFTHEYQKASSLPSPESLSESFRAFYSSWWESPPVASTAIVTSKEVSRQKKLLILSLQLKARGVVEGTKRAVGISSSTVSLEVCSGIVIAAAISLSIA
jgi:hypothetical protein